MFAGGFMLLVVKHVLSLERRAVPAKPQFQYTVSWSIHFND